MKSNPQKIFGVSNRNLPLKTSPQLQLRCAYKLQLWKQSCSKRSENCRTSLMEELWGLKPWCLVKDPEYASSLPSGPETVYRPQSGSKSDLGWPKICDLNGRFHLCYSWRHKFVYGCRKWLNSVWFGLPHISDWNRLCLCKELASPLALLLPNGINFAIFWFHLLHLTSQILHSCWKWLNLVQIDYVCVKNWHHKWLYCSQKEWI